MKKRKLSKTISHQLTKKMKSPTTTTITNNNVLVLPLLSTAKYQFNRRECIQVLSTVLQDYHQLDLLVLLSSDNNNNNEESDDLAQLLLTRQQSIHVIASIDQLLEQQKQRRQQLYFCGEVSWRFQSASDATTAIHKLDPTILEQAKQKYKSGQIGHVYPMPASDELCDKYGIHTIYYAMAPNFNPDKPNCLQDQQQGNQLLSLTYHNVFKLFLEQTVTVGKENVAEDEEQQLTSYILGKYDPPPPRFGTTNNRANWQDALIEIVNHPTSDINSRKIYYRDDHCVVMYDAFPKSTVHLLCVAVKDIHSISELNSTHIPLIEHMKRVIDRIVSHLTQLYPELTFKSGCHSIPSMSRLHIHINSCDFITDCMKNKKHYNSFNTDFYVPVGTVLDELRQNGRFVVDKNKAESLIAGDLKCHVCSQTIRNIPQLKTHIAQCLVKNISKRK